jgi:hypothetical protein
MTVVISRLTLFRISSFANPLSSPAMN